MHIKLAKDTGKINSNRKKIPLSKDTEVAGINDGVRFLVSK